MTNLNEDFDMICAEKDKQIDELRDRNSNLLCQYENLIDFLEKQCHKIENMKTCIIVLATVSLSMILIRLLVILGILE